MRWISWLARVRPRTFIVASLIVSVNVFAWLAISGRTHDKLVRTSRHSTAIAATRPADDLRIIGASQTNYDWKAKTVEIEVRFNRAVESKQILPRLQLLEEEAHRIALAPSGSPPSGKWAARFTTEAMPRLESANDQRFQLSLLAEPAKDGAISVVPLGAAITLGIATDQRVTAVTPGERSGANPSIDVSFSSPVDEEAIRQAISIEPSVPFTIQTTDSSSVQLCGAFKPATRYAVKIADRTPLQDASIVPRGGVCTVFIPDRPASVWFDHASGFLGSAGSRRVTVHAVNLSELNVTISRLYDNNLVTWRNIQAEHLTGRYRWRTVSDADAMEQEGRVVGQRKILLNARKNEQINRDISLDDLLPADMQSDGVLRIDVTGKSIATIKGRALGGDDERNEETASTLLTLSDIALTAKESPAGIVVWATSLKTAMPLRVNVQAYTAEDQLVSGGFTDRDGLICLKSKSTDGHPVAVLLAERWPDNYGQRTHVMSWLDLRDEPLAFDDPSVRGAENRHDGYDAFVYADRGVYRPGETVQMRTIVRGAHQQTPKSFPIEFHLKSPDNRSRETVRAMLDGDGSAQWSLHLPAESPTGSWTAVVQLPGDSTTNIGSLAFQVEEFIPDRIRVQARFDGNSDTARHAVSDSLSATIHGDYLFSQPAAKLPVTLICRLDPTPFTSKAAEGWTMNDDAEVVAQSSDVHASAVEQRIDDLALDDSGRLIQSFDCDKMLSETKHATAYQGPWLATLTAEVRETGGRAVSDRTFIPVDRAERYVAIKASGVPPVAGSSQQFAVKLLRPDGSAAAQDCELNLAMNRQIWNTSWSVSNGRYSCTSTRRLEPVTTREPSSSPSSVRLHDGVGTFTVNCAEAGEFTVAVTDPQTNRTVSTMLDVSGGAWADSVSQEHPESLQVTLLPRPAFSAAQVDALCRPFSWPIVSPLASFRNALLAPPADIASLPPGEVIRAVVRSPFAGTLLLSVESDHVMHTQVIAMTESSLTVPLVIDRSAGTNAFVSATVVRAVDPHAAWRVHRAFGVASIRLDESEHQLKLQLQTPPQIKPEQSLPIAVRVTDRNGKAVANAAVTLAVVDEGICQLTHFITPDPFSYFTRWHQLGVQTHDTYAQLMPDTDRTGDVGGDEEAKLASAGRHSTPISARRVRSLAMMSEVLHSDANGVVRTDFPMPPFVGKSRIMAVSYAGDRFGAAEESTIVKSDLVVQSSWPRFAAPGDRFRVPLVIFNNTPHDGDAIIHLNSPVNSPLLLPSEQSLLPVHVAAGRSATCSFEIAAAPACGVADVTTDVSLGDDVFHETISLPVRPASPMQRVSGTQTLTPGKPFAITPPANLLNGVGQFSVRITPQPSLNLPEGLDYLNRYPYGCAEQTVSGAFPLVYLPDLGELIGGDPYPKDQVREKVTAALDRLVMMQTRSGALPMWTGGADWPWVSIYAAHFCVVAEQAGYVVPAEFAERLLNYVRAQLDISSDEPDQLERGAYACYVLALTGHADISAMSRLTDLLTHPLIGDAPRPTAETAFHLAAAWTCANDPTRARALRPQFQFEISPDRELSNNVSSPTRERAVMLSTLLMIQPDHPQIPMLAEALAEAGRKGEWRSTQDVAFAVMALGQYARASKAIKPFTHAELCAGDQIIASAESGAALAWSALAPAELIARIDGPDAARGYVHWISDGVPLTPSTQPTSAGMEIDRRICDESGKPIGTSSIHSGELLNVEITLKCPQPLEGIVIEDLLPAGLEPENPRLDESRGAKPDDEHDPQQFAVSRQDFRDDRVVLFGDASSSGTYRCSYRARAVTSGTFIIPPISAECMYDLATHAQSAGGGKLIVEPMNESSMTAAAARAE